jgi:alpha-glucosidase (family GH31 glycosyl hydrolase)
VEGPAGIRAASVALRPDELPDVGSDTGGYGETTPELFARWSEFAAYKPYPYGSELLVAPVAEKGARERALYLPEGRWLDYSDKKTLHAGAG